MPNRRARAAALMAALLASTGAYAQTSDPLAQGFRNPPNDSRPRTWWHWLNGNITEEGITKSLEWMKQVGLGGVQNFNASLNTPQIVEERLAFMTPAWKKAFLHAVETADRLDLEFAIASSPGWSETGGPWVKPADAMKKLVWSSTDIVGGQRFTGKLEAPATTTGPYGSAATYDPLAAANGHAPESPQAYGDVAVLAFPITSEPVQSARPQAVTQDGKAIDSDAITDSREDTVAAIPVAGEGEDTTITLTYPRPRTVRSATLFMPGAVSPFEGPAFRPILEAQSDSGWSEVAELPVTSVPATIALSPVTARRFRVRFLRTKPKANDLGNIAPGAVPIDFFSRPPVKAIELATLLLSHETRINRFEAKAGFDTVPDYYALDDNLTDADAVAPGSVRNITDKLRADGTLDWTPPPGRWRILRFGWSLLGTTNHPASPEATGLEVDKYDGAAVGRYFDHYLATYSSALAPDRNGIDALLTDSIEAGDANWTPQMVAQFQRLRGYDPTPWLPALSGVVIGSRARSNAFLYDYRRTLADLLASEHYGTAAKIAHEHGLVLYGEALEDKRPQLGNDFAMRAYADVPMAAMWSYPRGGDPRVTLIGDDLGAASVAHFYGRKHVAAESFTAFQQPWAFAPADLRPIADLEFALGINRPVIHTSVLSPSDDKLPGLSLAFIGQYFNRHESWAGLARPWIDYLARTGYMLGQGKHIADIAYFFGEEAPLTQLYEDGRVDMLPVTNGFDFVDAGAIVHSLSVSNGALVSSGGARYRLLYLGGTSDRMTLPTLRAIEQLVEAGATVVGKAPLGTPSLADDAGAFAEIVSRLWSGSEEVRLGKGRVIATDDLNAAIERLGLGPDFSVAQPSAQKPLLFQHRALDEGGHIYFVVNRALDDRKVEASFRVSGFAPELWHADTGTSEPLSYRISGDRTIVPLDLRGAESALVVFRAPTTAPSRTITPPALARFVTVAGPWQVRFEPNRGAPPQITMRELSPLESSDDKAVRYFSGVATYTTSFSTPKRWKAGQPLWLDLGKVGDVARLSVNGKVLGTLWHRPYRLDVGPAVRRGRNTLSVEVANLWVNRLIGDAQPDATKVTFTTVPTYLPDAPLRPSGLIGPVTLAGEVGD